MQAIWMMAMHLHTKCESRTKDYNMQKNIILFDIKFNSTSIVFQGPLQTSWKAIFISAPGIVSGLWRGRVIQCQDIRSKGQIVSLSHFH